MKSLKYQQNAIFELTEKVIKLLNISSGAMYRAPTGGRRKIIFEAPTGAGKTVMACQTLANIVDELRTRGDSRYKECAFIWFAPRKLHLQSYMSLKGAFGETRKLSPVMFDELDQSEGIQPGEILFVNWESVNKEKNIMVRDSESSASLYEITRRTQEELGLPIVAIIDEEHMFWSNTADKTKAVLDRINPAVELRISATPKTMHPDALVKVQRQDVIAAEMIKKEAVLNPEIDVNASEDEIALNERLIKTALEKREEIAEAYKAEGVNINPLLLIQLPNDKKESMTTEDEKVAEQVKTYLKYMHDITEENGRLAVWLSNEKSNLAGLEQPDNLAQVLLFKEAIALGWDCPRAAVLLIFRKLSSDEFTIQTVGRILRMPEQRHYPNELLNYGYVYTDLAKDKINICSADASYILKDTLVAHRRADLCNVSLKSVYSERPNIERNYLGPDFRKVLYDTATEFWRLEQGAGLFSIAELAAMRGEDEEYQPLPETDDDTVNENRVYDSETNHPAEGKNHALLPYIQLNTASTPEQEFMKFLEANSRYIDWWYKNGDSGKANYAVEYHKGEGGEKALFYVDFVIRMKNGHIYLFDTKSAGSDIFAADKHNALLRYIAENSTAEQLLAGGVILQQGSNWLYSPLPIEDTTDTLNWSSFYPQQA